jgi:hypothetical protein
VGSCGSQPFPPPPAPSSFKSKGIIKPNLAGLVTDTCNPSYSGGRDQEDRSSKPAQARSSRPYLKKTNPKRGWQSG